ncbi:hypothetical protein V8J88_19005 [Massilia sp. W12]|uniref:hypothetical protein n=1 Tax=Massilia sp. W12 TaxID=3126507 RepID=UPI0030CD6E46
MNKGPRLLLLCATLAGAAQAAGTAPASAPPPRKNQAPWDATLFGVAPEAPSASAPQAQAPQQPAARQKKPKASPPLAPPLPFQYLGQLQQDGVTYFLLQHGTRFLSVQSGQQIDPHYVLQKAQGNQLHFVYLPLRQEQILKPGDMN